VCIVCVRMSSSSPCLLRVKQSTGHTHTGHTDRENTPDTGTHTRTTRPPNCLGWRFDSVHFSGAPRHPVCAPLVKYEWEWATQTRVCFGWIFNSACLCVFCVGPLCSHPLRWWVLCEALPSVLVPCGWGPLSCSRFPWHLFLVLPLARAHALAVSSGEREWHGT